MSKAHSKSPPTKRDGALDDKEQPRLFIKKAREIGADESESRADELLGKLAKSPPVRRMRPTRSGRKLRPSPEECVDPVVADVFVVQWTIDKDTVAEAYKKQCDALERVGSLFDKHGLKLQIEIHLNRVAPPPSTLYNAKWLRQWNENGRPPVRE